MDLDFWDCFEENKLCGSRFLGLFWKRINSVDLDFWDCFGRE